MEWVINCGVWQEKIQNTNPASTHWTKKPAKRGIGSKRLGGNALFNRRRIKIAAIKGNRNHSPNVPHILVRSMLASEPRNKARYTGNSKSWEIRLIGIKTEPRAVSPLAIDEQSRKDFKKIF